MSIADSRMETATDGNAGGAIRMTPRDLEALVVSESMREGKTFSSFRGKLTPLVSELSASTSPTTDATRVDSPSFPPSGPLQPSSPSTRTHPMEYEQDSEPIHVVRTVLPDEHPLRIRDEMMTRLIRLRRNAEEEMGLRLHWNDEKEGDRPPHTQQPPPTFRWYFQPCSPLGASGSSLNSPKIQCIPSYIDLEGYCTGIEDDSETDGDEDATDDDDDDNKSKKSVKSQTEAILSPKMRQLTKERRHVAVLKNLEDPFFLFSGYLLKQSIHDPNVWRRVYCVLSEDRMWTIGRMRPLRNTTGYSNGEFEYSDDILPSLRVGRHSYIKLHRSLLLEEGDGSMQTTNTPFLSPLGRRLPHAFRILTAQGTFHTFRAFNASSFRLWVTSLAEKIAQTHGDGLMDLANLIAEEETLARSKRMDNVAESPLLEKISLPGGITASSKLLAMTMDVTRFGISVAEFKELCRHVDDATQPNKNHGLVVNVQTKVRGIIAVGSMRQSVGGQASHSSNTRQRVKNGEHVGMVSSVWEEARILASKSAQLLHALAAFQNDMLKEHSHKEERKKETDPDDECKIQQFDISAVPGKNEEKFNELDGSVASMMENLLKEQKEVQILLGKRWDSLLLDSQQKSNSRTQVEKRYDSSSRIDWDVLPPMQLFDPLLKKLQCISAAMLCKAAISVVT